MYVVEQDIVIELFSVGDVELIIREIKDKEIYGYGIDCDKQQWLNFIDYLQTVIEVR